MKRITNCKKITAMIVLMLIVSLLLCACGSKKCALCGKSYSGSGHSTTVGTVCDDCYYFSTGVSAASAGSNTGVWIAITVMVFVAVFAATSGVVYLVLQRVLPEEKPAPRATQRQETAPVYRAPQRPASATANQRPVTQPTRQPQRTAYTQEWVCARDHSRNFGPYCTLCGAPRPQQSRPAAQQSQQPQQTRQVRPTGQSGNAYYAAAQRQQPQPTQQQPTQQPVQPRYVPEEPVAEAVPTYSGKFARKPQPEAEPASLADDAEFDAELLAAIFREAEQGDQE